MYPLPRGDHFDQHHRRHIKPDMITSDLKCHQKAKSIDCCAPILLSFLGEILPSRAWHWRMKLWLRLLLYSLCASQVSISLCDSCFATVLDPRKTTVSWSHLGQCPDTMNWPRSKMGCYMPRELWELTPSWFARPPCQIPAGPSVMMDQTPMLCTHEFSKDGSIFSMMNGQVRYPNHPYHTRDIIWNIHRRGTGCVSLATRAVRLTPTWSELEFMTRT